MSTRNELLNGANYEGFEGFCDTLVNHIKNNWRQSDPQTALTQAQPGMIASDADDDKLYHKLGAGGPVSGACQPSGTPAWDEVLQEHMSCDVTPTFDSVDLGDNSIMTDSRARAYLTSDQLNINDSTYTKVLLDDMTYDSGGNFDDANNKFIAPVTGLYLCIGVITWKATVADKPYIAALYVNGVSYSIPRLHTALSNPLSSMVIDVPVVIAGQAIELYCWHNAGVNTVDISGDEKQTYLVVHLLSI